MTKKVLCICLVLCTLISFSSCQKSIDSVVNETPQEDISLISVMLGDKYIDEWNENGVIQNVTWNKLKLSEDDEKKFPEIKKAFDKFNDEALNDAKLLMDELTEAAKHLEGDEYNPLCLEGQSKVYLLRADTMIISLLEDVFVHSGGVHPNYYYITSNFNPQTGEKLGLTDVIPSIDDLPDILERKLNIKYDDYITFGTNELQEIFNKYSSENYSWTLDYQGVTFWFSPYEIASYAAGPLSVKIYFDEEPYIFNEEYTKAPENYGMMIPMRQKIDFDLNSDDDKKDCIEIDTMLDQYGSYSMLSVTVNDKTYTDDINYAYDFDVYLAHVGDKNYIYSDSFSDNDYHIFCTWDINGNAPRMTQELYGTEIDYEYIEEGYEDGTVYRRAFNNPENLILETRFDILGTRGATAAYKIDETNGIPKMTDDSYTFNYGHDVKTIIPLEAEILPDMKKTEIPIGTSLIPYQTDGTSFVDLKDENGKIVRLSIDVSEWPKLINGIPEVECFEELLYVG